ncbi:MAG: hypothetical protein K6E31_04365 [bacterium]|nr:hypothetical protein [bacterium]
MIPWTDWYGHTPGTMRADAILSHVHFQQAGNTAEIVWNSAEHREEK